MKTIITDGKSEFDFLKEMKKRSGEISLSTNEAVMAIINEVKEKRR